MPGLSRIYDGGVWKILRKAVAGVQQLLPGCCCAPPGDPCDYNPEDPTLPAQVKIAGAHDYCCDTSGNAITYTDLTFTCADFNTAQWDADGGVPFRIYQDASGCPGGGLWVLEVDNPSTPGQTYYYLKATGTGPLGAYTYSAALSNPGTCTHYNAGAYTVTAA